MHIVIKCGYNLIAIPITEHIGHIVAGMEKAVTVIEPSWNETNYKINTKEKVTFTIVPDSMIGTDDPLIETIKADLSRAHEREAEERTKRMEVEKELEKLKEKFAPFLEKEPENNT